MKKKEREAKNQLIFNKKLKQKELKETRIFL